MNRAVPASFAETTDLERRVLAHEKVLQALIAYMARTEPRFIDHLRVRFVEPMNMARHEHDHRETDDYAAEFVRAVVLLGDERARIDGNAVLIDEQLEPPSGRGKQDIDQARPSQRKRVQIRQRSKVWEVKVDDKFHGDYHQKEHALAAGASLNLSLR